LLRCRKLTEHLGVASEGQDGECYKMRLQELAPMVRECRYNLGMGYDDAADEEQGQAPKQEIPANESELSFRGQGVVIHSDKIKVKLLKLLKDVEEVKVSPSDERDRIIETYGAVHSEFRDVLQDIHGEMIKAGADVQTEEWRMLEAFTREMSYGVNVERNVVLLSSQFTKLDQLSEISSLEARKTCKVDEGVRFCDMLKEDLENLKELPESTESISKALTEYMALVQNCRCMFLSLSHSSVGKCLEAAALMDMLHGRIEDAELTQALSGSLERLHAPFQALFDGLQPRVAQWRCRGLAQLCREDVKSQEMSGQVSLAAAIQQENFEDLSTVAAFPPRCRDIPCKPLLFDLAFRDIVAPDIDDLKCRPQGQQKGFLGRVAGGLGSRLGGLWGRK